jgi:hypothetical protein
VTARRRLPVRISTVGPAEAALRIFGPEHAVTKATRALGPTVTVAQLRSILPVLETLTG